MRVLVVEDERLLADTVADGLRRQAIAVDVAYDGEAALERVAVNDYDVVVLDRDLPRVSGDEVCTALVESGADTRILMLTAATAVPERVAGLGLGADDYLTKPFAFAELAARIEALGRRARPASADAARAAGVDMRTHLQPAPVKGDGVLLERLAQNLIDNAIRYNLRERGEITVTTERIDDSAHLTVENTGPAIPPYEIPSLFDPFRRAHQRTSRRLLICFGQPWGWPRTVNRPLRRPCPRWRRPGLP